MIIAYSPLTWYTAIGRSVRSIAVSEQTRVLVDGYFELRPMGAVQVKGLAAPAAAYEITGLGPLQDHFQLALSRGLTKFVGREHEIGEIGR